MKDELEIMVGTQPWSLRVPEGSRVELEHAPIVPPARSAAELVRDALEHPHEFEAMRRALAPDDHVVVVLDGSLPHAAAMLGEVIQHLQSGGVHLDAITVLTPPGATSEWIDELADEYAEVRTEVHDPADRNKLAYLATTSGGRRVYLNRTLVDADFVVVLSARRYDPQAGYAGAESAIFPALADEEARAALAGQLSAKAPGEDPWPARAEAAEAVYLLGMPFFVQAIEGEPGTIHDVVSGLPPSTAEGMRRLDLRWRATTDERPDTVVVAVAGAPGRVTFLDLARAAACGARVVKKGGHVAILTAAAPGLGDGARLLRSLDDPAGAKKLLAKERPNDWPASYLWAYAARRAGLYLASGYPDDVVEELFATPIRSASEVLRLIDAGGKVLVIPDANRMMVTLS